MMGTFLGWGPIAFSRFSKADPDLDGPQNLCSAPSFETLVKGTPGDTTRLPETLVPVSSLSSLSHELKSLLSLQVLAELSALYVVASGKPYLLKKTSSKQLRLDAKRGSRQVPTASTVHLPRAMCLSKCSLAVKTPLKWFKAPNRNHELPHPWTMCKAVMIREQFWQAGKFRKHYWKSLTWALVSVWFLVLLFFLKQQRSLFLF